MNHNYKLNRQLIVGILFISVCLQSCKDFSSQSLPQAYKSQQKVDRLTKTKDQSFLVGQEFAAEKGYLVSFCEQDGNLQANVKIDVSQKTPNYTQLPVVVAKDVDLSSLAYLDKHLQQRYIQVERSSNGKPSRIVVARGALKGGMMEGEVKDLREITELGSYFDEKRGYLELTSQNYEKLIETCQQYTSSFTNYNAGLFINKWEDHQDLSDLSQLLNKFSKVTKLAVRCNISDKAALTKVLAVSIKLYKQLTELDINGCQLGDASMKNIVPALVATRIQTLDLSENNIGNEGASNLVQVLPHTQVRTLNLCKNNIGDEGASKLSMVLPATRIQTLDLRENNIGNEIQSLLQNEFPDIQFYF